MEGTLTGWKFNNIPSWVNKLGDMFLEAKSYDTDYIKYAVGGLIGEKIYAVGQGTGGARVVASYNTRTNEWSDENPGTSDAKSLFAGATVGTKVYTLGGNGYGSSTDYSLTECYDSASKTWSTKKNMTGIRYGHSATSIGTNIHCIGGQNKATNFLKTHEVYSTTGNTWTTKPDSLVEVTRCTICNDGTNIYQLGGYGWSGSTTDQHTYNVKYDTVSETWTKLSYMPNDAEGGGSVYHDGKVYHFGGGRGLNADSLHSTVFIYDIASNKWTTSVATTKNGKLRCFAVNVNGSAYIVGGAGTSSDLSKKLDVYIM